MPSDIYLAKGEILNMTITAVGETLDGTWDVDCYMEPKDGGTDINLAPTIAAGVATVSYDTVNLDCPSYKIDIRFTQAGVDVFSQPFFLFLSDPITPASAR